MDVRIGLARVVGGLCRQTSSVSLPLQTSLLPPQTPVPQHSKSPIIPAEAQPPAPAPTPLHVRRLAERLQKDESREVRSFVPEWSFAPLDSDSTTDSKAGSASASESKAGLVPPVTPAPSTSDAKTPAATPDAKAHARPALMKKTSSLSGDGFVFATFSKPPPVPPIPLQESDEGETDTTVVARNR